MVTDGHALEMERYHYKFSRVAQTVAYYGDIVNSMIEEQG